MKNMPMFLIDFLVDVWKKNSRKKLCLLVCTACYCSVVRETGFGVEFIYFNSKVAEMSILFLPNPYYCCNRNKVIITMVIKPLDDPTYCTRSAFTQLGVWRKLIDCSWHHFTLPMCCQMCSVWIFLHLQPFSCNLKRGLFDPAPVLKG